MSRIRVYISDRSEHRTITSDDHLGEAVALRKAGPGDAQRIARLHIASWQATYTRELPAEFLASQDVAWRAEDWRTQLAQGVQVLLAEEGAELSGFIACGWERPGGKGRPWEIYNLHVSAGQHRKGVGSILFHAAVRLGGEQGAEAMVLWVVDSNWSARRFYERRGMQSDGGRQDQLVGSGHLLHEVRYRMALPGRSS
jgi:ribosomal protein S18 acetylase RimI-like enzyme